MRRLAGFGRDDDGGIVVEFGLVVPILLLVVFGIVDFGRAYHTLNNLTSAVREGARYGAVLQYPEEPDNIEDIKQRVVDFAYQLGGEALTKDDVTVDPDVDNGMMEVSAVYTFVPITPLAPMLKMGSIPMQQKAVFRLEFADNTTP